MSREGGHPVAPPLTSADARIAELAEKTIALRVALSSTGDARPKEIHDIASQTLSLSDDLLREAEKQAKRAARFKADIAAGEERLDKVQSRAEVLEHLTMPEILAIQDLVTERARRDARRGFWVGILVSFPIGVVASSTASWIVRVRRRGPPGDQAALPDRATEEGAGASRRACLQIRFVKDL